MKLVNRSIFELMHNKIKFNNLQKISSDYYEYSMLRRDLENPILKVIWAKIIFIK